MTSGSEGTAEEGNSTRDFSVEPWRPSNGQLHDNGHQEDLVNGRSALVLLVIIGTVLVATPASAGGGSWLEVTGGQSVRIAGMELSYAVTGSTVSMRSEFFDGQLAPVGAGPWFAYLSADDQRRSGSMLLAPVAIAVTGGHSYVATTSFVVPDVPPGDYSVTVCDLGCRHEGVGDLFGGELVVGGATEREARLTARLQIRRWMLEEESRTSRRLRDQLGDARFALEAVDASGKRAISRATAAEAEVATMTTVNGRLATQVADRDAAVDRWRWAAGVLAALLLASCVLSVRLMRRPRLVLPDTPAELIDGEHRELSESNEAAGARGALPASRR